MGFWAQEEFPRIVNHDFLMVIISMLFVFVYICIHSTSFALGCFAICQILLSVPLALFFYVIIFQIPYFAQVHNLAIFIILGVGADDIFVFMDAWRQSGTMPSMKTLEDRMVFTYSRTSFTVLNTSLTTAIAFFATAAAPIMPIASFGVFAAMMIILNWVMVCTWWPTIVLVWEVYFCRARGIGCCFSCDPCCRSPCKIADQTTNPASDPNGPRLSRRSSEDSAFNRKMAEATNAGIQLKMKLGCMERFFHGVYGPILVWHVGPYKFLKPVSILLAVGMFAMGGYFSAEAATLSTPEEEPKWFPSDHMFTGLTDEMRATFLSGDDDSYISGNLYLGLLDIHNPFYSKWTPEKNRGTVVYDQSFDISRSDAQSSFLQLCADLRTEPCDRPDVCTRPPATITSLNSVSCFLEDFQAYKGGVLPTGASFHSEMQAWVDGPGNAHSEQVGLVNGVVKFVRIDFVFTALTGIPVSKERLLYDRVNGFLDEKFFATAPASLSTCFVYAGRTFPWMTTSESLVTVVLNGFAIIFPCAFIVLFLSSGSIFVAGYATMTVAFITFSVLGFAKIAFGFSLGIGEAIAGNIVIGLSVDYTLHLSHAYMEATDETREAKLVHAATMMGVTVVGGAITTFCSSLFMLACQLTFFARMCTLLSCTIGFSICYAFLFFMPVMALVGPVGEQKPIARRIMEWRASRQKDKGAVKPQPGATSSSTCDQNTSNSTGVLA